MKKIVAIWLMSFVIGVFASFPLCSMDSDNLGDLISQRTALLTEHDKKMETLAKERGVAATSQAACALWRQKRDVASKEYEKKLTDLDKKIETNLTALGQEQKFIALRTKRDTLFAEFEQKRAARMTAHGPRRAGHGGCGGKGRRGKGGPRRSPAGGGRWGQLRSEYDQKIKAVDEQIQNLLTSFDEPIYSLEVFQSALTDLTEAL